MRTNLLFFLLFCSLVALNAQAVLKAVEEMPRFPGCEELEDEGEKRACSQTKLLEYIFTNIGYPQEAIENDIEGTVVVNFIVEKDGSLSNIRVVREIGGGCGAEAQRIVELMNEQGVRWIPGKDDDEIVRVSFNLPVKYKLETDKKSRRKRRRERRG